MDDLMITVPLFNGSLASASGTLSHALTAHCHAVEAVFRDAGLAPGVGYSALDVARLAVVLMSAPAGVDDRFPRWTLPETRSSAMAATRYVAGALPF